MSSELGKVKDAMDDIGASTKSELTLRSAYRMTPSITKKSHKALEKARLRGDRFILYIHAPSCKLAMASFRAIRPIVQRIHATRSSTDDIVVASTIGSQLVSDQSTVLDYWMGLANAGKPLRDHVVSLPSGAQCFVVKNKSVQCVVMNKPICVAFSVDDLLSEDNGEDESMIQAKESARHNVDVLTSSVLGPYVKRNVVVQIDVDPAPEIDRLETALIMLDCHSLTLKPYLLQILSMRKHDSKKSMHLVSPNEFAERVREGAVHKAFTSSALRLGPDVLNRTSYLRISQNLVEMDGGVDHILSSRYSCDMGTRCVDQKDKHSVYLEKNKGELGEQTKCDAENAKTTDADLAVRKPWKYFMSYDGRGMMRFRLGPVAVSWEMTPSEMVQGACGLIQAVPSLQDIFLCVDHGIQNRDDLPSLWIWDARADRTYVNRHAMGFLLRLARIVRQSSDNDASAYGGISASPEDENAARAEKDIGDQVPDEMSALLSAGFYRKLSNWDTNTSAARDIPIQRLVGTYRELARLRNMKNSVSTKAMENMKNTENEETISSASEAFKRAPQSQEVM